MASSELITLTLDGNTYYIQDSTARSLISALQSSVSEKQENLVSGTNIKTINNTTLLGSGNVSVQQTLVSGTNIKTINGTSLLGSGNISITGESGGEENVIETIMVDGVALPITNKTVDITGKQETLVSGTNIKTINNVSLLGYGNISLPTEALYRDTTPTLALWEIPNKKSYSYLLASADLTLNISCNINNTGINSTLFIRNTSTDTITIDYASSSADDISSSTGGSIDIGRGNTCELNAICVLGTNDAGTATTMHLFVTAVEHIKH